MKKTNPFKFYFLMIGGFFFILSLIIAITISVVWYVNGQKYHTYNSVNDYKESEITPFYDMYDAYEYIFNDKEILMSKKQRYIIEHDYDAFYTMKDVGKAQVNATYLIYYETLSPVALTYDYAEHVHAGMLYIAKSIDTPKGIQFTYVPTGRNMYYTVRLTILNEEIDIKNYIDKIKDYILLTEKYNK